MTTAWRRITHHEEEAMGTVVTIDLFGDPTAAKVSHLVERACRVLHEADEVFSTWRKDSPISRVRRGELPVEAAAAVVAEVLRRCADARTKSGGWFDPWAMPGGSRPYGVRKGLGRATGVVRTAGARRTRCPRQRGGRYRGMGAS